MALVYRSVPVLVSNNEYINQDQYFNRSIESACYDLGFISFDEIKAPFFNRYGYQYNTFKKISRHVHSKYFFLFPYDAVLNTIQYMNSDMYSSNMFHLLEFDIPDDILLEYCGYGYYDRTCIEFKIKESIFKENDTKKELDNDDLIRILNSYKKYYNDLNREFIKFYRKEINLAINSNRREYSSDFITGKNTLFYQDELLNDDKTQILNQDKIIYLLKEKGIVFSDNMMDMHSYLDNEVEDVLIHEKLKVKTLKKELKKVLPELSKK